MSERARKVPASFFKAHCLRIMDEVARTRSAVIVTKRGKPLIKVLPAEEQLLDPFGGMAGTIKIVGNIIDPIDDLGWTGDADNI